MHTGQIPQPKRRAEIHRFKNDPDCRLFLSTDSGSVGLNLQAANVVINLDMPWNPAKLEQRIARAWRKHQKRSVQVINLVAENSIEHRMLTLLDQKRALAEGVVDGRGEKEMSLPSGRAAFLERLNTLIAVEPKESRSPPIDPLDRMRDDILAQWSSQLELMELHGDGDRQALLVVVDRLSDELQRDLSRRLQTQFPDQTPQLQLLDRDAFATIQQLIDARILNVNQETVRTLYRETVTDKPEDARRSRRLSAACDRLAQGEHKRRMAQVLSEGGFSVEAIAPMHEAVETGLQALALWQGHDPDTPPTLALIDSMLVKANLMPPEILSLVANLREDQAEWNEAEVSNLLTQSDGFLSHVTSVLESADKR